MNRSENRTISEVSSAFKINDLVFARLKGHKPWPAQIQHIDDKTYKNITKYRVTFFATNETADVNKSEICHYSPNKAKYPPESIGLRKRNDYKNALLEIEKVWKSARLLNRVGSPVSLKQTKTLSIEDKQYTPSSSTPLTSISVDKFNSTTKSSSGGLRDASVNTMDDFDLNSPINIIATKCTEIESSLLEIRNQWPGLQQSGQSKINLHKNNEVTQIKEDFHTQILKKELEKFKVENLNLQKTVEILQNDCRTLELEVQFLKENGQNCAHCYPPLQHPSSASTWQTARNTVSKVNLCGTTVNTIETKNRFDLLVNENEEKNNTAEATVANIKINKGKAVQQLSVYNQLNVNKAKRRSSKLLILADSHGRQLSKLIKQKSADDIDVCSIVKPNAKLDDIIKTVKELSSSLGKDDHLLVIGGTNNIGNSRSEQFLSEVHSLASMSKHTNLILSTLPLRFDTPSLDLEVAEFNSEIEKFVSKQPNISLLPLHLFPRYMFTSHGLHMNRKGKNRVVEKLTSMLYSKEANASTSGKKFMEKCSVGKINVVETNMKLLIDKMRYDPSVAFAHTISSDFTEPKHMSAGVAVHFRNKFGRPQFTDFVSNRLTQQKDGNGATVFSLVTKANYWGKPSTEDYDNACTQLIEKFKTGGFQTLICSPLGCVRDLIKPDQFIRNIVQLHRETNATIIISSYYQQSTRSLRNGLSHLDFIQVLQDTISKYDGEIGGQDLQGQKKQQPLSRYLTQTQQSPPSSQSTFTPCSPHQLQQTPPLESSIHSENSSESSTPSHFPSESVQNSFLG